MRYFAYGSNMSSRRLRARVPSAEFVSVASLPGHELRFHKQGRDGSSKCDVHASGSAEHRVFGVVFEILEPEKPHLDRAEGLGYGYLEKTVELVTLSGEALNAFTYYAIRLDDSLQPFHWYKQHVLIGAREHGLPDTYVAGIASTESVVDPDPQRHRNEMSIYILS